MTRIDLELMDNIDLRITLVKDLLHTLFEGMTTTATLLSITGNTTNDTFGERAWLARPTLRRRPLSLLYQSSTT
jgi:hypothetical protein